MRPSASDVLRNKEKEYGLHYPGKTDRQSSRISCNRYILHSSLSGLDTDLHLGGGFNSIWEQLHNEGRSSFHDYQELSYALES
jgi:hypothetical protein